VVDVDSLEENLVTTGVQYQVVRPGRRDEPDVAVAVEAVAVEAGPGELFLDEVVARREDDERVLADGVFDGSVGPFRSGRVGPVVGHVDDVGERDAVSRRTGSGSRRRKCRRCDGRAAEFEEVASVEASRYPYRALFTVVWHTP
jgi:hypothetical protein